MILPEKDGTPEHGEPTTRPPATSPGINGHVRPLPVSAHSEMYLDEVTADRPVVIREPAGERAFQLHTIRILLVVGVVTIVTLATISIVAIATGSVPTELCVLGLVLAGGITFILKWISGKS